MLLAEYYASENYDERPDGTIVDTLVIHAISLPPTQYGSGDIIDFFQNKLDTDKDPFYQTIADVRVSAHFFIDRNGQLIQFVPTQKRAWHAGASEFDGRERVNDFSIGIELEGHDYDVFTFGQYQTLAELTRDLMRVYPSITRSRIIGHDTIAPGRKTDPGPGFNWRYYFAQLAL